MAKSEKAEKPKKQLGKKAAKLFAGLLVGCSGAVGVQYVVGAMVPAKLAEERAKAPVPMEYVEVGKVTLPLVDEQGDLVSYVKVEASLEVPEGEGEAAKLKLPVVLHEINMVTWRSALSKGSDGRLVDTKAVEKIFVGAAKQVYGKDLDVKRVLVTSAIPS
jgi:hypothetical protein